MAEAAISTVVQLLGDLLIQKVNFLRGVEDKIRSLKDELTRMQAFMRDANKKQAEDERVRNWISEIRELALDAEDTIELFTLNVETAKSRSFLERCACFPSHLRHLDIIGEEIESIHARLAEIDKSRERYGIKDLGEVGEPSRRSEVEVRRRLSPWHKDEHLVGIKDEVKKLLEPIMDQEKKGLYLAAVVGMGGIGKSTLAREVYNHTDIISSRFDCRAWVVVSSEFTPLETIKQLILEATTSEQQKQQLRDEIKNLEKDSTSDKLYLERKLKELLHKQLEGKTYFIVLDDVWEKDHWESLITAFPKEQDKTNRLLLTTRNNIVANQCPILYEMKFLDSETSWELFVKKGLGNSNEEFPEELEQIGRDIVEKCGGLPLAITVMGGLLAETRSNRVWEEALNQLNSHLKRAESSISAILELSYQNLSPTLKSCFLCLAFFKEDATIPVKRLVNIMVGQGLIQHKGSAMVEEIAKGYLDELINRNVVQVKNLTLDSQVKSCHLHDSLRKICLEKAMEEIGLENLTGDRMISLHKPRHRIVQCNDLRSFPTNQNKHIRSLFLLDVRRPNFIKEIKSSYWKTFKHLKNLEFDGVDDYIIMLPDCFQLLRGLKQLSIYGGYSVISLPTWLNTLKKLEILELPYSLVQFPNVELEMDSLRHFSSFSISRLMIANSWKNVETLKYIMWDDWLRSSLRMKDAICNIRELGIDMNNETLDTTTFRSRLITKRIGNVEWINLIASFEKLGNLVKLYLRWDTLDSLPIDSKTINIPRFENLTKLKLHGPMEKCPSTSMLPPNLSYLRLRSSQLHEDPMKELSKLPKLSYLKLKFNSYRGERMQVLHDGFPSLRGLSLQGMSNLKSLDIEEGGMPQLKLLRVVRCPSLDTKNLSNKFYQLQIQTI